MKSLIYIAALSIIPLLLDAQCFEDRHSTNIHESWMSCDISPNPNPSNGNSHWVMFDLGTQMTLHQSTIWNMNHPDYVESGVKKLLVQYSQNGTSWSTLGTYTILQSKSSGFYEGTPGPNFDGISARYVLLTATENYGGECFGFSEFRIFTEDHDQNSKLDLEIEVCINEGELINIDGGLGFGGIYSGPGVNDNGDGTFNFDPDVAFIGENILSYNYTDANGLVTLQDIIMVFDCDEGICPPCISCDETAQSTFDNNPIPNGVYHKQFITSEGHVNNNYNVDYRGAESVTLEPSFEVKVGANFVAQIRECDQIMGTNGDFESGINGWDLVQNSDLTANLTVDTNNPFDGNQSARLDIITGSSDPQWWNLQLIQTGASLIQGQEYKVTFAARADQNNSSYFYISRSNNPWNSYAYWDFTLTENWKQYQFTFIADEDNNGFVRITAGLGMSPAGSTVWIDNFTIRQ